MGITKTTDLTNSVVAKYEKQYYLTAAEHPGVWAQFIDWQAPISENGGNGSSIDFPVYDAQDLVENALTEDTDIVPDTISDDNVTLTPYEYGKTFALSKKSRLQSRTNLPQLMGKLVSMNRVKSIDRILRRSACGRGSSAPTQTLMPSAVTTMAGLDATSDKVSFAFLQELTAYAASMDIEPFEGAGYLAIIHPTLAADLKGLTEWTSIGYYQDKMNIYGAVDKPFTMAGITFVPSTMGRLHLGSGTALHTATTSTAAVNKGGTSLAVTEATGIGAGAWITVGTVETESVNPSDDLEQVYVTAGSGTGAQTLTIRGNGYGEDFGFRFNHASGVAIVEAPNVASIPLIGKNSLIGVYASEAGQYGVPKMVDGSLDLLGRMSYWGWWWYGGVAAIQKRIVLGRVAVSKWILGTN